MMNSLFFPFKTSGSPWVGTKQPGVGGAKTLGLGITSDPSGNVFVAGHT